ncbi:P2RY2 protein, partial [Amia calva]|nr:P2RY2 protein [Amia calva]
MRRCTERLPCSPGPLSHTPSICRVMNSSVRNDSAAEPCMVEPQSPVLSVFLCLVFLGGLLLNCFSLWLFWFRVHHWTPGIILQFHLALSDALMTPSAPFMVFYLSLGSHWPFGQFLCQMKVFLLSTHLDGSIFFLTLISMQRYVTVVLYNQRSRLKNRAFVCKLCCGVWLLLLLKGLMFFLMFKTSQAESREHGQNHTLCLSVFQMELMESYIIGFVLLVPCFLLPFGVSLACYSLLACSVSKVNSSTPKGRSVKAKSLRMITICVVIFTLCFIPLEVSRTLGVVFQKVFRDRCSLLQSVETAYYVSWILAGANCCLDPLIYCYGSRKFTKAFRSSMRKIGVQLEEQSPTENELDTTSQSMTRVANSTAPPP